MPESSLNSDEAVADRAAEHAAQGVRAAQSGEPQGPHTSRPPSIPISYGGEDWLTLSLYLFHGSFADLVQRLDACRKAADDGVPAGDEIYLGDRKFLVLPYGAKVGSKRTKAYFRWQLKSSTGFTLQLMNTERSTGSMPNGKLVASSLVLMRYGLDAVVEQASQALKALGSRVIKNKISRVDVCCDLPGAAIEPLKAAFDAGYYVSRATASDEHGLNQEITESDYSIYRLNHETTSFNLGRRNVRMRVYEKVKECGHDLEKLETLIERRWGVFTYRAIRVEFQLRREKLKQVGVDNLADWRTKRAAVVNYLVHEWFRLTAGDFDPKHPERSQVLPEWQTVQNAFAAWTGSGPAVELGPLPTNDLPPDHFVKTIVGSFVSMFAKSGVDIDSNDTFFHEGMSRVLDEIEHRNMSAEVQRRVLELGVEKPRNGELEDESET